MSAAKRRKASRARTNPLSTSFPADPYDKFHEHYAPEKVRESEPSRRSGSRRVSETIVVDAPVALKDCQTQEPEPAVSLERHDTESLEKEETEAQGNKFREHTTLGIFTGPAASREVSTRLSRESSIEDSQWPFESRELLLSYQTSRSGSITSTTETELPLVPQRSSCPESPLLPTSEEATMNSMYNEIATAAAAVGNLEPVSEVPEVSRRPATAQLDPTSTEDKESCKAGHEQALGAMPTTAVSETSESTPISVAEEDGAQLELKVAQKIAKPSLSKISTPTSTIEKNRIPEPKPKIRFVIQNSKGALDFRPGKLLPSSEFRDSGISDFFALYAHRSGMRLETIESLTFTVVFAKNATIAVKKTDNESVWKTVKKRLSSLFSLTRMEDPEETDFEVYIRVGNMRDISDEGEDEDFAGF
jgi:hypothetical protein